MSTTYILGIRHHIRELTAQAKTNDDTGLTAKKRLKELSSDQKKVVWLIFYNPEIKQNAGTIEEIYNKLNAINDTSTPYEYTRYRNCLLKINRAYKNRFQHRMSTKKFIADINSYRPKKPLTEIELEEVLKSLQPTLTISLEIIDNLASFLYENEIYKHEGFFRIPGNSYKSKEFRIALLKHYQEWKRSPRQEEIKTIIESIVNLQANDIGRAFKALINDLPIADGVDPQKSTPQLAAKYLSKHLFICAKISTLLQAIIDAEAITKLNGHGLSVAFPAVAALIKLGPLKPLNKSFA